MAKEKKLTNQQVADVIAVEGLGYAIMDYMGADSIRSKELAKDWQIANDAMVRIEKRLKKEIIKALYGDDD